MERRLLDFLGKRGKTAAGPLELRLISAAALLRAQKEAAELAADGADAEGLYLNACVLAQAAFRPSGQRAFESGRQVLERLPAEQIGRWTERYLALCAGENPACSAENRDAYAGMLKAEPYERLKWQVLRAFGVLPSERRAQEMTDGDYLYCVLHMTLDGEEAMERLCPECREAAARRTCVCCGAPVPEENPNFDESRFEELKRCDLC